jgi:hypothetical protein
MSLIIVVRDQVTGEGVDHQFPRLAMLGAGNFKVSAHLGDLDVRPAVSPQFFVYLGDCDRLIAGDKDFALVGRYGDENAEPRPPTRAPIRPNRSA